MAPTLGALPYTVVMAPTLGALPYTVVMAPTLGTVQRALLRFPLTKALSRIGLPYDWWFPLTSAEVFDKQGAGKDEGRGLKEAEEGVGPPAGNPGNEP
ncbi:unnamed protein product [Arctogadus glacialis]